MKEIKTKKYKLAKENIKGGLADGQPDSKYDKNELEKGIKVEYEHTDKRDIAKEIAKDHLEESDDYYVELEKMEKKLEEKEK